MLTISNRAHDVIRKIPRQTHLPDTAGLRISGGSVATSTLRVVESPKPKSGDRVLDYEGARVFVDSAAVGRLSEGCLDVRVRTDGRLEFAHVRPSG